MIKGNCTQSVAPRHGKQLNFWGGGGGLKGPNSNYPRGGGFF